MAKEKKSQPEEQIHKSGERIITATLKNIKDGKDTPQLAWPGCSKFFPPR